MKRLMPSTLVSWLTNNPNCIKADCFAIELPTGETLYATEGQWDITFPASTPGWTGAQTTFRSQQYGAWSRGKITSEASTKANSNTMDLSLIPQAVTLFPGTGLGILAAVANHLFDGATVWVYTAYMPLNAYGNVLVGIETKFQGTVTKTPKLGRNLVQFDCADPLFLLNMKVPSRLIQSSCPWQFGDVNCSQAGLDAANFVVEFVAASGSTAAAITPATAFTQAAGYFTQGVITCLTGENAGLSQTVKVHASGALTLMQGFLLPVLAGDTFQVIKGCDKSVQACASTLQTNGTPEPSSYQQRFGGTPFSPVPSSAI
jgi:hypothetical protein